MKEVQLFINGEFLDNGDREMRDNINPATEEVIGRFPMATEADVEAAVDAAFEAQKSWEKVPAIERAGYLMELVELVKENADVLARATSEEMGKPTRPAGWPRTFSTSRRWRATSRARSSSRTVRTRTSCSTRCPSASPARSCRGTSRCSSSDARSPRRSSPDAPSC